MNVGYLIHQAERPLSVGERREADARRGELALALSRLLRRNRSGPAHELRHGLNKPQPGWPTRDPVPAQQAAEGEREFAAAGVGLSPFPHGQGALGLMDQVPDVHPASPW